MGLYLYPLQIPHVASSMHSSKTSHALFHGSFQKNTTHLFSAKTPSHKTVSRKISHDTTESPKKPEISTLNVLIDTGCYFQNHAMPSCSLYLVPFFLRYRNSLGEFCLVVGKRVRSTCTANPLLLLHAVGGAQDSCLTQVRSARSVRFHQSSPKLQCGSFSNYFTCRDLGHYGALTGAHRFLFCATLSSFTLLNGSHSFCLNTPGFFNSAECLKFLVGSHG